ncbi:hypothetical protein [Williamsoniiplasma lucivorax]|nr:hypothetical protein [Williamsoniiplasma lucivorax]
MKKTKLIALTIISASLIAVPIITVVTGFNFNASSNSLWAIANFRQPTTKTGWEMLRVDAIKNKTRYFQNVENLAYDTALKNKTMDDTSMNDYISFQIEKGMDFQFYLAYVLREMLANVNLFKITQDPTTYQIQGQDLDNLVPFELINLTSNNYAYIIWNIVKEGAIALTNIPLNPDLRNLVNLTLDEIRSLKIYDDQINNLWTSGLKDYFASKMADLTKANYQKNKAKELNQLNLDLAKAKAEHKSEKIIEEIEAKIVVKKLEIQVRFDQYNYELDQFAKNITIYQNELSTWVAEQTNLNHQQLLDKVKEHPKFKIFMLLNFYQISYKEQALATYQVIKTVIPDLVIPDKFVISDWENHFMLLAKQGKNTIDFVVKSKDEVVVNLNEIPLSDEIINAAALQEYKGGQDA